MKLFLIVMIMLATGCGSSAEDSTKTLPGNKLSVLLVRAIDEEEYSEVKGSLQWLFFKANIFKQIAEGYVEPDFYGDSQACTGTASGTYSLEKTGERQYNVTLVYDSFGQNIEGLCRVADRVIEATLQPSGFVDFLDSKRVQRFERLEKIQ